MPHASHNMTCILCKKVKPAYLFYAKYKKADRPICRACSLARVSLLDSKKTVSKSKSKFITKSKYGLSVNKNLTSSLSAKKNRYINIYKMHKKTVFQLFGNKCKMCGNKNPIVLQIDHINGGGTKERKKTNSLRRYKLVLEDPSKYQLLCANCNVIKKYMNKEI